MEAFRALLKDCRSKIVRRINSSADGNLEMKTNPKFIEIFIAEDFQRHSVVEFAEGENKLTTSLKCRSIRIGSYKFETSEKVRRKKFHWIFKK